MVKRCANEGICLLSKRWRGQGVQAVEATLAQLRILEASISLESDGNPLFEKSG
jgi:hypothetical protein